MNISICITTFNEGGSIGKLLESLLTQTKKPEEIIVVDGGSTDKTLEIINHYQKRDGRIKLLREKCSRARGRNLGVEIAKNEIIAMTDAGCVADRNWLERITQPFINEEVDISAGFYKMSGETSLQKALSVFLGTTERKFDVNFLPSTRSIAFRKSAWEAIGGFPDEERNSAEDTYFNFHALKLGMKYARVKSAVVEWGMPEDLKSFFTKIKSYAEWDAKTKIWFFPGKGLASHNIKALFVLLRYLIGLIWLALAFFSFGLPYLPADATRQALQAGLLIGLFAYFVWSFRKIYLEFGDYKVSLWGPVLQIATDFAVMSGFISGIIRV